MTKGTSMSVAQMLYNRYRRFHDDAGNPREDRYKNRATWDARPWRLPDRKSTRQRPEENLTKEASSG